MFGMFSRMTFSWKTVGALAGGSGVLGGFQQRTVWCGGNDGQGQELRGTPPLGQALRGTPPPGRSDNPWFNFQVGPPRQQDIRQQNPVAGRSASLTELSRGGLGKMRHLEIRDLWLQREVAHGQVKVFKTPGTENPADLMTKILSWGGIFDSFGFHEFGGVWGPQWGARSERRVEFVRASYAVWGFLARILEKSNKSGNAWRAPD